MSEHRILVVDDDRDGAESLALLLRMERYATQTAYDGMEALRLAREFAPHVVLLDISMPELDGFDVASRLRSEPWAHPLRVIALTAWNRFDDRARARVAGFDGYLVKPVDFAMLQQMLRAYCARPD
jgi:CheY-like chemotaxis protein